MSTAKTLKSLTLAGYQVTPSDQWILPLVKETKETERDVDGTLTRIVKPVAIPATGPIRDNLSDEARNAILNTVGWEMKAELYDGKTFSMTDCSNGNEASLNTDGGVIDLEITGNPDLI